MSRRPSEVVTDLIYRSTQRLVDGVRFVCPRRYALDELHHGRMQRERFLTLLLFGDVEDLRKETRWTAVVVDDERNHEQRPEHRPVGSDHARRSRSEGQIPPLEATCEFISVRDLVGMNKFPPLRLEDRRTSKIEQLAEAVVDLEKATVETC